MGTFGEVELDGLVLTTPRLALRPWRADDAPRVAEIMADDRMHEFLPLPRPYGLDDARQYVEEIAARPRADATALPCAVVEAPGGRLVGSAVLRLTGEPEIGYWIAGDARGRGYAAEATRSLAEWAFSIGVARVSLLCEIRNVASARVALAAGFTYEGTSRNGLVGGGAGGIPERRGDLARFARLADDPGTPVEAAFAPMPAAGLPDGVIRLRPVDPGDADDLAACEDETTAYWNFSGTARSPAEVAAAAARARLDWLVGTMAYIAMVDEASGRVAGSIQLRKAGPPQVGGIGYVVAPEFRGRRYTTRALQLLAPWAFEQAGFARLELGAKVGNEASLRAAAAAGWAPDGIRRSRLRNGDGSFADEVRYALINPASATADGPRSG